jgi:hypothetical protein
MFVTVPEGQENNLLSIKSVCDFHTWCVDEKNLIHDYQIVKFGREFWTETVIRRPWDVEHVIKAFPEISRLREHFVMLDSRSQSLTVHGVRGIRRRVRA